MPPAFAGFSEKGHSRLRSEEHTSELQSRQYLVCRLLLEKKKSGIMSGQPNVTTTTPKIKDQHTKVDKEIAQLPHIGFSFDDPTHMYKAARFSAVERCMQ